MSDHGPRRRGETTPQERKRRRQFVLSMAFLIGASVYLVLLVTVWDRAATALGIVVCGVIGAGIEIRRNRRRRQRR